MSEKSTEWSISYKQIGVILISFILGLIVALLVSNSQTSSSSNFTTTELIGFVLSVILSGASIVLAIAAITLGKSSELAVINRSDESIRLQTEVFTKTTDALQGIKASTDVTEKRIEDIISGRAGDISRQIAELASDETSVGAIDMKELEDKIKKSITGSFEKKEITEEEKKRRQVIREHARKRRQEYEMNHDKILYDLANKDDVKIIKLGHGNPTSEKNEPFARYDAVFDKNKEKIAISTFMPTEQEKFILRNINEIITRLASDLESDDVEKLYLIFFDEPEDSDVIKQSNQTISIMKDEISSKIHVCPVAYSETEKWALSVEL